MIKKIFFGLFLGLIIGSSFTPGTAFASKSNQIDDSVFYNYNSMSEAQIANWISSNFPNSCLLSQNYPAEYNNSAWRNNTFKEPLPNNTFGGVVSPARIIWRASQLYGLNPQVVLTTLEKESDLVSGSKGCSAWRYNSAMGYNCWTGAENYLKNYPDIGIYQTCVQTKSYAGFSPQVDNGTWQLGFDGKRANGDLSWGGWGNITYYGRMTQGHRARVNGGTVNYYDGYTTINGEAVYLANGPTAALYNYTPFFTRFESIFTGWFGSTHAPNYAAQYAGQSAYPTLSPGASTTVYVNFKNTSNQTWYDITVAAANNKKSIKLASLEPTNRSSIFVDDSWHNWVRPSATFAKVFDESGVEYSTNPHIAKPGEVVQFTFTMHAPATAAPGVYKEVFGLVEEGGYGVIPMPVTPWLNVTVEKKLTASFVTQSSYPTLKPGQSSSDNFITFKNTGNVNWYDNQTATVNGQKPIRLATMTPLDRVSIFADTSWGAGKNRPAGLFKTVYDSDGQAYSTNPHIVKPGESAKFQFLFVAPDNVTPGTYKEYLGIVEDGGVGTIPMPITPWLDVTTTNEATAKPQEAAENIRITKTTSLTHRVSFKNTGTTTWTSAGTTLKILSGDTSGLRDDTWLSQDSPARLNESSVAPGGIGTFDIDFKALATAATYKLKLSPVISGEPISLLDSWLNVIVENPVYSASYYNQSPHPTMLQNSTRDITFRFKNTGNTNWYDKTNASSMGVAPTVLMSTYPTKRTSQFNANFANPAYPADVFSKVLMSNGQTLASNQHVVQPGEIAEYTITLTAPDKITPDTYREFFQPAINEASPIIMGPLAWTYVTIKDSSNIAKFYTQSAYPTIQRGETAQAFFLFKNTGNSTWYNTEALSVQGLSRVTLATTNPINRPSKFGELFTSSNRPTKLFSAVYASDGITLTPDQTVVKPDEIARFSFTLKAPSSLAPGVYREDFQPILEGGDPWSMQQVVWLYITVE